MVSRLVIGELILVTAAWALTGWVRKLAIARGIQDVPNERSSHKVPTPRGGGLAIVAVSIGAWLALARSELLEAREAFALIVGGAMIALVGWLDDRRGLSAAVRLAVHIAAGFLLGYSLGFEGWQAAICALFAAWLTNIYNFMDGIDGLAAGEAVTAAVALGSYAYGAGQGGLGLASLSLAAASLGFLFWNWNPAKIFMGDVASGFLGYVFSALTLALARQAGPQALAVSAILLAVFIADSSVTLARRAARGQAVWKAHREHAYQKAVQAGHRHGQVSGVALAINVLWLVPCALAYELYGGWAIAAAYALPLALVLGFRAGTPEGTR